MNDVLPCYVGSEAKRQKTGPHASTSSRKKSTASKAGPDTGKTQATVDQLAENKAEHADVKLVDPNTGAEVKTNSKAEHPPAEPKAGTTKGKKGGKVVDPNSGQELDAAASADIKPPAKSQKTKDPAANKTSRSQSADDAKPEPGSDEKEDFVKINRAPVLTLWVAVVAERQGFSREAGLSFGKAISGMLAQSKGR